MDKGKKIMDEDEKKFWDLAGGEAGAVFLGGVVRKYEDEKSAVVARMQRAQREAERATADAKAELINVQKDLTAVRAELADERSQRAEVRATREAETKELAELSPKVKSLRAEHDRFARAARSIVESEEKVKLQ